MTVFREQPTNERHEHAGWRLAIAGTGGQGVLTAARLLCDVFVEQGHEITSSQLHGMAQRGGSVQSSVMIDCGISPVIAAGAADFVVGLEPVETARAVPLMSSRTVVLMNTAPVIPYVLGQRTVLEEEGARYPDVKDLQECIGAVTARLHAFDATKLATEAGSPKTLNTVMLGCLLGTGSLPCPAAGFWNTVAKLMPQPLVEANARAFFSGVAVGEKLQLAEARS
ncbi:MAG: indolepyruvate oxidoreductase subunit beta [Planctomycetota bacterium]